MASFYIESIQPKSTLIPESGFVFRESSSSWINSLASNPAFSAIAIGSCLKALA